MNVLLIKFSLAGQIYSEIQTFLLEVLALFAENIILTTLVKTLSYRLCIAYSIIVMRVLFLCRIRYLSSHFRVIKDQILHHWSFISPTQGNNSDSWCKEQENSKYIPLTKIYDNFAKFLVRTKLLALSSKIIDKLVPCLIYQDLSSMRVFLGFFEFLVKLYFSRNLDKFLYLHLFPK
ncbi:unnamed protein product [Moneuplotes crassus]|uniref:Uncharacterized protein n=1 Tax=Euplotes crassus TaxID=5936 RepID=A0AAD1XIB4_EUPCR|nr:unnamed protein product [Moneuplotes crassus]